MNSARLNTTPWSISCFLLVALQASIPIVSRAENQTSDNPIVMPPDAATHGEPMKMDEIMPSQMKRDGMTKQAVMDGDMAKRKIMDEKLKQEESMMEEHP
jgi:hypothetical protein